MNETSMVEIGLACIGIVGAVIGYLLDQRDAKQAGEIALLFKKHDLHVERQRALELELAHKYYIKDELDRKFEQLNATMRDGLNSLGMKFDEMTRTLIQSLAAQNSHKKE